MKYKQHENLKLAKFTWLFYIIFTVIGFVGSIYFFLQEEMMNGLIFVSIMIMMGFFAKQEDTDLTKRRLEEFICKVNGKKWEDYCECEKCKGQHSYPSVKDEKK